MEIFGLDVLKSAVIILVVLIYWKFVYYKYHKEDFTPISVGSASVILVCIGIYALFFERSVVFAEISFLYYVLVVFLVGTCILEGIALSKHEMDKDIDITFSWLNRKLPFIPVWLWMTLAFPAFLFMIIATFKLFGKEYFVLWAMILLAWAASGVRLLKVIKKRMKN